MGTLRRKSETGISVLQGAWAGVDMTGLGGRQERAVIVNRRLAENENRKRDGDIPMDADSPPPPAESGDPNSQGNQEDDGSGDDDCGDDNCGDKHTLTSTSTAWPQVSPSTFVKASALATNSLQSSTTWTTPTFTPTTSSTTAFSTTSTQFNSMSFTSVSRSSTSFQKSSTSTSTSTSSSSHSRSSSTTTKQPSITVTTIINSPSNSVSPFLNSQGVTSSQAAMEQAGESHDNAVIAIVVTVVIGVALITLAIVTFMLRRALARQKLNQKPLWPWFNESNSHKNNEDDEDASSSVNHEDHARDTLEIPPPIIRPRSKLRPDSTVTTSASTISSGFGDGLTEIPAQQATAVGSRRQTRYSIGNEKDLLDRGGEVIENPFKDQRLAEEMQNPFSDENFIGTARPPSRTETMRAAAGTLPLGFDMVDEKGVVKEKFVHARMMSEGLEEEGTGTGRFEQGEGRKGEIGGVWEDPFTVDKRGTNVYLNRSEEERREGRWRNAASWVVGQVERVRIVPKGE